MVGSSDEHRIKVVVFKVESFRVPSVVLHLFLEGSNPTNMETCNAIMIEFVHQAARECNRNFDIQMSHSVSYYIHHLKSNQIDHTK